MADATLEALTRAIYGQESSSGAADTAQPNYAGARGPMQITKATFDGMKTAGLIPTNYDHANAEHSKEAGEKLVAHLYEKFGNDPRKAAAAYYAGDKAVQADGSIKDYRDLKNDKAPSTLQYVEQVMKRMGLESNAEPVSGATATRAPVLASWDEAMPGRSPGARQTGTAKLPATFLPPSVPLSSTAVPLEADALDAEEVLHRQRQQAADDTSFMDSSRAAFMHQGMGAVIKSLVRPDYEPVPGFKLDPKRLAGLDASEQEFLKEAVSEDHAQRIEWEIKQRREDMEAVNVNGTGVGIAASLFAGLPEGYLMGMGAMRALQIAKLGSAALASQGRAGAALASSVAENVGTNVLATSVQDKFDPYVGAADYAMAVAGGGIGVALTVPSLFHRGGSVEAQVAMNDLADTSAKTTQSVREAAVRNLGPDATAEQLTAEAARLEGNQVRQQVTAADAPLPEHRRLLPEAVHPEQVEKAVEAAKIVEPPAKLEPVVEEDAPAFKLPKELTKAAPRFGMGSLNFKLEFSTDLDKALFILGQQKRSKSDQKFLDLVMSHTGMTEVEARAAGKAVSERIKALAKKVPDGEVPDTITVPKINEDAAQFDSAMGAVASTKTKWSSPAYYESRAAMATSADSKLFQGWKAMTRGAVSTPAKMAQLPTGVTALPDIKAEPVLGPAIAAANDLASKFLKGSKVVLSTVTGMTEGQRARGEIMSAGKTHVIGLNPVNTLPDRAVRTVVHEIGHAIANENLKDIPPAMMARIQKGYQDFLKTALEGDPRAKAMRYSAANDALTMGSDRLKLSEYNLSFDEYAAEQFVKYVEKDATGERKLGFGKEIINSISRLVKQVLALFGYAKTKNLLEPSEGFSEFFDAVLTGQLKELKTPDEALVRGLETGAQHELSQLDKPAESFEDITNNKTAQKHGLDLLPLDTPQQRAEAKALVELYKKADEGDYKADPARLSKLMNTAVFQGGQSTANTLLQSQNPVARMVAAELLESPSGAAGRRNNAAIKKFMEERRYLGNTLNEFQDTYKAFRNAQGGNVVKDFFDGRLWEQFNRLVAEEIEARGRGVEVQSAPAVRAGADALEGAYERMRVAQQSAKTTGWASLPTTSRGYMPHRMSPEKVRNMTTGQARALHSALTDQFIGIEGFDMSFADALAAKYVDRVRRRALGGFDTPAGIHQVGAADVVQDALESMGMSREEVIATMQRYMAAGPGYTKKRLKLDLNAEYDAGDGGTFRLMDLFETDQFRLLRSQSKRVSGEVALSRHGVMGKSGLALLRRAMEFGADGQKVQGHELEAFDQVAAEFLGDPFGTQSKLVDRVMQVNSLSRLGGMGFTQFAEAINGIFHVGALRTLDTIGGMLRLRDEIKTLAKGEKVDNPIIGSLEKFGGAEFGTDQYKTVFPFDNQSLEYNTYGQDTLTAGDRLLRGAAFTQGKLSMWRSIHSTQQRGFAEQIVRKAAQFIKDGTSDAALRDMGIDDTLIGKLRGDIDNIAKFEGGRLTDFDITKAKDIQAAEDFTQAVHRGVSQIIQGTFIGEQGHWVHDGMMRLVTQFRTFSLTSIEKQWARQVGNVGTSKALGMMLGAMSIAAPVYMARTYLASIGRSDQEAYLEKQLTPAQIARASLNYIAMSGLAGDFLDATTAVTGLGTVTGGRTGVGKEFVGNVVAPAAGLVDDVWRGLQNTKEGTDPHELVKALPFSRLPWMIPAINALGD